MFVFYALWHYLLSRCILKSVKHKYCQLGKIYELQYGSIHGVVRNELFCLLMTTCSHSRLTALPSHDRVIAWFFTKGRHVKQLVWELPVLQLANHPWCCQLVMVHSQPVLLATKPLLSWFANSTPVTAGKQEHWLNLFLTYHLTGLESHRSLPLRQPQKKAILRTSSAIYFKVMVSVKTKSVTWFSSGERQGNEFLRDYLRYRLMWNLPEIDWW